MIPAISAVCFDFDGTLADTDEIHHACWNKCLTPYELQIDVEFYARNCSGELSIHIADKLLSNFPDIKLSGQMLAELKDQYFDAWINTERISIMPGVTETLSLLKTCNISVGLVTGAPLSAIVKTLHDHAIRHYFDTVVTREDITRGKPDPQGYLIALKNLNTPAKRALSFEDTKSGVLAAKAAGMTAIAIPNRYTFTHDFGLADFKFTNMLEAMDELIELLK